MAGPLCRLHDRPCPSLTILPVTVSHLGLCMLGCRAWHHGSSNSTQRSGESLRRSHTWSTRCWDLLASLHFLCAAGGWSPQPLSWMDPFRSKCSELHLEKILLAWCLWWDRELLMWRCQVRLCCEDGSLPGEAEASATRPHHFSWEGRGSCQSCSPVSPRLSLSPTAPWSLPSALLRSPWQELSVVIPSNLNQFSAVGRCEFTLHLEMRSKTCIPQQQMDYHRPWRYIYNQVKPFNIFEQIDFPKAPPAEGACTGHACPLSAIWADQHIGKWWFKGKIIANFKIKKRFHQTICVFFFVVFFWFRSAHHVVLLQQARVERYLSQGGLILEHDWNHCFRTRTHQKQT